MFWLKKELKAIDAGAQTEGAFGAFATLRKFQSIA